MTAAEKFEIETADHTLRGLLGYRIKRAFLSVRNDLAATLQPFGLRMITFSVLSVVIDRPMIRQSELAEALAMERSNLVPVMDGLQKSGLIGRHQVEEDRRVCAFKATDKGRALFKQALMAVRAHERRMYGELDPAERLQLESFLSRVESAWQSGREET